MGWPEIFEAKKANVKAGHGGHRDENPKGSRHEKPSPTGETIQTAFFMKTAQALDAPDQAPVSRHKKKPHLCAAFLE